MVKVNKEKCNGCGTCLNVCPQDAISLNKGKAVIDKDKCVECGACISVCSQNAIK